MTGKGIDVVNPLDLPSRGGRAAYALSELDADAGRSALERAQHQLAADIAVEADPVHVRQALEDQGRGIGHVGDAVGLTDDQPLERAGEVAVQRCRVARFDPEVVHSSSLTVIASVAKQSSLDRHVASLLAMTA